MTNAKVFKTFITFSLSEMFTVLGKSETLDEIQPKNIPENGSALIYAQFQLYEKNLHCRNKKKVFDEAVTYIDTYFVWEGSGKCQ